MTMYVYACEHERVRVCVFVCVCVCVCVCMCVNAGTYLPAAAGGLVVGSDVTLLTSLTGDGPKVV